MNNRYISTVDVPAYNPYSHNDSYKPYQLETTRLRFKVCERRDLETIKYVESRLTATIKELKERLAYYFDIISSLDSFYLEIYDAKYGQWMKIDNSDSDASISELRLQQDSLISISYSKSKASNGGRYSYATPVSKTNHELILKLCRKPLDRTYCIWLYINSSATFGQLRKQAYAELNKMSKDAPIFVWNKDNWIKLESDMDDAMLATIQYMGSYTFISTDYDEDYGKSPSGLCGLANLGSTCFMNSVWQCLSNIPEFKNKLLAYNDEINAPVIGEYIKLMKQMWSGRCSISEPLLLIHNINDHLPHYSSYRQQDAQEFMHQFLHLIHAELSTKETLITELFYGQTRSTVKCLECQHTESTNESISFLPLPISSYNQKTILFIKTDGEQRLIPIQMDASITDIGHLIDAFIQQHEPTLTRERIVVCQLVNNIAKEKYETWRSLLLLKDKELVFIECPEKLEHQRYIWCDFFDRSTDEMFRPSTILVCPTGRCYYAHLSEQLDQILGHLCSVTGASISDCNVSWRNRYREVTELSIESNANPIFPDLEAVIIRMSSKLVDIYKARYDTNNLSDNSGLRGLLTDFFREEPLIGDYHCLKCPKPTKARQKSDLCLPLPRVLIIQLKRFTYDAYSNDKIDTFISFPLNGLDLREYIVKDDKNKNENDFSTKYDLVAVSNHIGSLSSGHYTTYAKNAENGKWYLFDDKYIRKLDSEADVVTKNAYILVYVQKPNDKK